MAIHVADQNAINEQEWARPENWSRFGVYRSQRDMRLWVPKRNHPRLGWTLNFAHPGARWAAAAPALVPLGFILLFVLYQLSR